MEVCPRQAPRDSICKVSNDCDLIRLRRKRINRSAWCAIPASLLVGLIGPVMLIQALYGDPFSFIKEVKGEFISYRVEKRLAQNSECFRYRFFAERDVVQSVLNRELSPSDWKIQTLVTAENGTIVWKKQDSSPRVDDIIWVNYTRPNGEFVQVRYDGESIDFIYTRPMAGGFAEFWEQIRNAFTRSKEQKGRE